MATEDIWPVRTSLPPMIRGISMARSDISARDCLAILVLEFLERRIGLLINGRTGIIVRSCIEIAIQFVFRTGQTVSGAALSIIRNDIAHGFHRVSRRVSIHSGSPDFLQ